MNRAETMDRPAAGLSPHLAAACIFARAKRERASCTVPPTAGVLAELAKLGHLR